MHRLSLAAIAFVTVVTGSVVNAETGFLDRSVVLNGETYRYQVYVPIEWTKTHKWPVVVFLHENGRQGSDGSSHLAVGGGRELSNFIRANRPVLPAVVVFPQGAPDTTWVFGRMHDMVAAQIEASVNEFNGDADRVYLWGNSVGAAGVLRLAARWPNRFAAVVAAAGYTETPTNLPPARAQEDRKMSSFVTATDPFAALAASITHLPLWLFHGDADTVVSVEQSRRLALALRNAGAPVRYTEYAGASHGQALINSLKDNELIPWLLAQKRGLSH